MTDFVADVSRPLENCHFFSGTGKDMSKDIADELLPPGWVAREARSKPGRIYYLNLHTRKSTWIKPTVWADFIYNNIS